MRLHRLGIQAFGPYAERQDVDFDELNDAGVFLLTGPTGAGKSSVLDAVCFALYGVVPGDRDVRGLRSGHAAPDLPPLVELELTLCGRRLRIERSPEWQRPKRRGEGTTTERSAAKLFETVAGAEQLLSDRVQEIGHELGPLLGMTSEQFRQVVLLPQGGFHTFLKATSDERRAVLERLFATQRFTRIEGWVHDRATVLRRRAEEHRSEVVGLLATSAHRAGCAVPDVVEPAPLEAWRLGLVDDAADAVATARAAEAAAREQDEQAQRELREVTAAHAVARRRTQARTALAALAASDEEEATALARLLDHGRASSTLTLLRAVAESEQALAGAQAGLEAALARLPQPLDLSGCQQLSATLQQRIGEIQGVSGAVSDLTDAESRAERCAAELETVTAEIEALAAAAASLPETRDDLRRRLTDARATASRSDDCRRTLQQARLQRAAAADLPAALKHEEELSRGAAVAHELANDARRRHLDVVERRLLGMAAELAGQLRDGAPCQVCGSVDHPHPAASAKDAVTREHQDDVAEAAERARAAHEAMLLRVADARERRVLLASTSGGLDLAEATAAEETAERAAEAAERALGEAADLAEALAEVERRGQQAEAQLESLRSRRDELGAELAAARDVVARTGPRVGAVLGEGRSVDAALTAVRETLESVRAATRAHEELAEAERHDATARRRARETAEAAGFADLDAAAVAALDDGTVAALEALVAQRRDARARAQGVLEEPEVRALDESGGPHDDQALAVAHSRADEAAETLRTRVWERRAAEERAAALGGLVDQLDRAVASWSPAREEHELAESMSKLVRGLGGDNHLQMRLSSYVLATRLDQVLEAANERLHQMRDHRYTLQRSPGARSARGRAGLDIDVLDDWTGEARAPGTLSGGETFKLSLALALGLADVITHESGGLDIETLFVDEGFGMLDPDTLDEVMDCIDDLRSGGRAVGVVSHVTELRSRISTQLQVTPSRSGSHIRVEAAAV